MDRRLTTILIADVVGYSALMAANEAGTLNALKAHRADIMDPKTDRYGGRVVKLMGDGSLMEFASVVDCVAFAVDVQRAIAAANADVADDKAVRWRMGINIGDVLVDGDDIYGDGVNVAARLEPLAEPGGICVSETVHQQIEGKLDLDFEDMGARHFKNIAAPLRVFQVRFGAPDAGARARKSEPRRATPPRPDEARGSVAVLPFDSLSGDPDDAFLADGIAGEILNMLSRFPDLRVAARRAVASAEVDPWTTARDLGLRYVLTGSVRRAGDRLRVIAELAEAATRTQLWSNTYERRMADLFDVQEEIAQAIVVAFGGEVLRAEWRRAATRPTDNLDAWELVQKARALNLPVNREAIDEALALAARAVEIDPTYAGAHALTASVRIQRVISGFSSDPEADRAAALAAVEKAGTLAPDDPHVLRTQAKVWSACGRQGPAVAALRRAVELAPFDFHSWGRLGRTLCYGADKAGLAEGQAILDRILARAPDHPMRPYWLVFKANACALEERFEDAARFAQANVDIQPGYAGAWMTLANALGALGRADDARAAMAGAKRANPAMTAAHLAEQIRVAAGGDAAHAGRATAGLTAAGLD